MSEAQTKQGAARVSRPAFPYLARDNYVTVSVVWATTEHEVACMVVVPLPTRFARPFVPEVKAATPVFVEDHVTELVMSVPPWSLAVNCWVSAPNRSLWLSGLIVMAVMLPQTVTPAVPVIPLLAAVMVAVPGATPKTAPVLALTDAIPFADDDQVAVIVDRFPLSKTPVATICRVEPTLTEVLPLLVPTVMEVRLALGKKSAQPATSSKATMAKMIRNTPDRPRLAIPTTSNRESYQIRIQREGT
jgi:hypothetical protein